MELYRSHEVILDYELTSNIYTSKIKIKNIFFCFIIYLIEIHFKSSFPCLLVFSVFRFSSFPPVSVKPGFSCCQESMVQDSETQETGFVVAIYKSKK